MTGGFRPWRHLLGLWLPAVLLCLGNVGLYSWLSSDSMGRAAQLEGQLAEHEASLVRLRHLQRLAAEERAQVEALDAEVKRLHNEVFGRLDDRLTNILIAAGSAARDSGLNVGRYSYSWSEEKTLDLHRFEIKFDVVGEYGQVRRLLAALQASPEFLVVDNLTLAGDELATSRELRISVRLATYLAEGDPRRLERSTPEPVAPAETATARPEAAAATAGDDTGAGDGIE